MNRAFIGFGVGSVCGVLVLAGLGAWNGYYHGHEWVSAPSGPPMEDAAKWAFIYVAYFWWLAGGVGGIIGGLAGLGSSFVQPRPAVRTRTADHSARHDW
jgi:hypothetical protein